MTTNKKQTNKLLKDMGAVMTPVFYIFGFVAIASAIIVCGFTPAAILVAIFLLFLAAAGASDINKGIVPDLVSLLIAVLAIVKFFISGITLASALDCLEGAVCLALPMLVVTLIVKGAFGGGDIKLMAAAGLYLGLDKTLIAGLITFLIAGCYGIIILIVKKKSARSKMRFAPYIALGCAFSELFGTDFLTIVKALFMHSR